MEEKLTSVQQQFKTLNKLLPNDSAYNIVSAVRIEGNLKIDALQAAWTKVQSKVDFPSISLIEFDEEQKAMDFIQKQADKLFNLDKEYSNPVYLIKISNNKYFFVFIQHHMFTDLHVKNMLSTIISNSYNGEKTSIYDNSYEEAINQSTYDKQELFWKQYLSEKSDSLLLPTGLNERKIFDGSGETLFCKLPNPILRSIITLQNENNLDPFITLLVNYSIVLSKLSGQNSFYLGIPYPNRRIAEREKMFGPFVNILPLQIKVDAEESFLSLYRKIRMQMLQIHRNQEMPFQKIARMYQGARDPKSPYFIQCGFTQEPPFTINLKGLKCSPVPIRPHGSQMDLFMTYWFEDESLRYRWEYNSHAFTCKQIYSWINSFESLLRITSQYPEKLLSSISVISDNDREVLRKISIENEKKYNFSSSLREQLIQAYSKNHNAIAICDSGRSLSYDVFADEVKDISTELQLRYGSGKVIAIAMNRSIDRLIVIHSIVCSGNIYLPLDPFWPLERITYMIVNSEVSSLITDYANLNRLSQCNNVILIDTLKLASHKRFPPGPEKENDSIALLYTSGSTGVPKGVFIPTKGIINRLSWMQEKYQLRDGDTLIHKVPYTFDVSMWEIFWPFLTGARLFIPDYTNHLDDQYLSKAIKDFKISYVHFVPSLLRKFFQNVERGNDYPDLKGMICSGETLSPDLVKEFYHRFPEKKLHNLYGPTEASIDVTCWTCSPDDSERKSIPIGYPIANTRIYIFDKNTNICPPYVSGEIVISGINLSSGYINNREETEKRFISGDWGWGKELVYLTGDIGYFHEDSLIEYQGRRDFQVKINGIRIELDEIEKQLEKNHYIRKAVVLQIEGKLKAFVESEKKLTQEFLKKNLINFLPGNMVPSSYLVLNKIPLLGNGKIDRKKLEKMEEAEVIDENKTNQTNSSIIQMWKELLSLDSIGEQVNFFDAGGHSLLIPQLKEKLEKKYNIEVSILDLFTHTTIASQKQLIKEKTKPIVLKMEDQEQKRVQNRAALRNRYKRTRT